MRVFLARHGHALDGEDDAQRPLSARGAATVRRIGSLLRGSGAAAAAHAIWHSPRRRARQTAELLAAELGVAAALVETSGLQPNDDPVAMADRLERLGEPVVIVGHEPHLSSLATFLVRGKLKPVAFSLKKGAVLALETSGGRHKKSGRARWQVCWHLSPELLAPPEAGD